MSDRPRQLGCGTYQVQLATRGGSSLLAELPWSSFDFHRTLNDVSTCNVSIPITPTDNRDPSAFERCCSAVSQVDPYATEVIVYRNRELVWAGPVVAKPTADRNQITVVARDLFHWFERRVVYDDTDLSGDLSTIFGTYVTIGLTPDSSPNLLTSSNITGVAGERSVLGRDYTRIADELRELARTGLDFITVGRTLYFGNLQTLLPNDPAFMISDVFCSDVKTPVNGLEMATQQIVIGAREPDFEGFSFDPPTGIAGGVDPTYGLVVQVSQEDSIQDQDSAQSAAESRLALSSAPPHDVTVTLAPEAPYFFNDLIPGRVGDVRVVSGCEQVNDHLRLETIDVSVQAAESGLEESVDLSFGPVPSLV